MDFVLKLRISLGRKITRSFLPYNERGLRISALSSLGFYPHRKGGSWSCYGPLMSGDVASPADFSLKYRQGRIVRLVHVKSRGFPRRAAKKLYFNRRAPAGIKKEDDPPWLGLDSGVSCRVLNVSSLHFLFYIPRASRKFPGTGTTSKDVTHETYICSLSESHFLQPLLFLGRWR